MLRNLILTRELRHFGYQDVGRTTVPTFTYTPTLLDATGRYYGYTILANPMQPGIPNF
jgi:hypothetical protein